MPKTLMNPTMDTPPKPQDKPEKQDTVEGEGSYTAAREYKKSVEKFVQSGQVEPASRRAAPDDF